MQLFDDVVYPGLEARSDSLCASSGGRACHGSQALQSAGRGGDAAAAALRHRCRDPAAAGEAEGRHGGRPGGTHVLQTREKYLGPGENASFHGPGEARFEYALAIVCGEFYTSCRHLHLVKEPSVASQLTWSRHLTRSADLRLFNASDLADLLRVPFIQLSM